MDREAYFARIDAAMQNPDLALPFERPELDFGSLGFKVGCCHANARLWAEEMPGWRRVRGWLNFPYATHHDLVAHSLVESPHGDRWDVTPYDDKQAMSLAMLFVRHPGPDDEFDVAVEQHGWISHPVAHVFSERDVAALSALASPLLTTDESGDA